MARNEEKQLGQLNRLYLHREEEERRKRFPPRPKLHTLNTAAEVAKHLPSIIRDIDISIKQSQVTCYTGEVSEGYLAAADRYRHEYEAFVRKMKLLDPSAAAEAIPWTDRPYDRKRPASGAAQSGRPWQSSTAEAADEPAAEAEVGSTKRFRRIESALLLKEEEEQQQQQCLLRGAVHPQPAAAALLPALQDAPLQFAVHATGTGAAATAAAPACDLSRSCIGMAARSRGHSHLPSSAAGTGLECCSPSAGATDGSSSSFRLPEQRQSSSSAEALPRLPVVEGGGGGCSNRASGLASLCLVYGDASSSDEDEQQQLRQQQ